jgi:hypothetical protein
MDVADRGIGVTHFVIASLTYSRHDSSVGGMGISFQDIRLLGGGFISFERVVTKKQGAKD